jgi:acyl-CoA dehydrogenase
MGGVIHSTVHPGEAIEVGEEVGRLAAPHAARHDEEGSFVSEGYAAVRKLSYGCLPVPKDLGGGGQGLLGMCQAQAAIAHGCASTSLAIAMHSHAVMTMAWRRGQGDTDVEGLLRRVATEGIILAASGTLQAAMVSIDARPVDGGYLVSGRRRLVSGAPGADFLVTAARLLDPDGDRLITVLAPLRGEGVTIVDDWDSHGMRGSGTNSVAFENAFVPTENALYVDRGNHLPPRAQAAANAGFQGDDTFRAMRMPGLHISLPIIGSAYLGAAEAVGQAAIAKVAGSSRVDNPGVGRLAGQMVHELRVARWSMEGMIKDTTDDSLGSLEQMITTLLGKRQMVVSAINAVETAIEMLGSATYLKGNVFERTLRDVRAGITHPLPPEGTLVQVGWATIDAAAATKS